MSKSSNFNLVAIVIPIYKLELSWYEQISWKRVRSILCDYPIFLCAPLSLASELSKIHSNIISFDDKYFESVSSYSDLVLSEIFYRKFSNYEYVLIYQLDAFIFRDDLAGFCAMNYDYIGAPWNCGLEKHFLEGTIFTQKVGNGGFSLRKVSKFIDITHRYSAFFKSNSGVNEDVLISFLCYKGEIHCPNEKIAAEFATEFFEEESMRDYVNILPMGCHAWMKIHSEIYKDMIESVGVDLSKYRHLMKDENRHIREQRGYELFLDRILYDKELFFRILKNELGYIPDSVSIYGIGNYGFKLVNALINRFQLSVESLYDRDKAGRTIFGLRILTYDNNKRDDVLLTANYDYIKIQDMLFSRNDNCRLISLASVYNSMSKKTTMA